MGGSEWNRWRISNYHTKLWKTTALPGNSLSNILLCTWIDDTWVLRNQLKLLIWRKLDLSTDLFNTQRNCGNQQNKQEWPTMHNCHSSSTNLDSFQRTFETNLGHASSSLFHAYRFRNFAKHYRLPPLVNSSNTWRRAFSFSPIHSFFPPRNKRV